MQEERVLARTTASWQDNKLVSAEEVKRISKSVRVSKPPEAKKLSCTQPVKTVSIHNHFRITLHTHITQKKDIKKIILPLSLTVISNCHGNEGTNGLKNFSAWKRNLLKPGFDCWKGCHTNTLSFFYKTQPKTMFNLTPNVHFISKHGKITTYYVFS